MIRNIVFDMGMVLMDYHPLEACRAAAPDEESALKVYAALFDHPEWVGLDDGSVDEDDLARHAMKTGFFGRLAEARRRAKARRSLSGAFSRAAGGNRRPQALCAVYGDARHKGV